MIRPDPPNIEYTVEPELQLCWADSRGFLVGDCDDAATLAAALLLVNRVPCWFVALRQDGEDEFSHVFCRTVDRDIDPIAPAEMLPHRSYAEKIELIL